MRLLELAEVERNARAAERRRIESERRRSRSKRDATLLGLVVAAASIGATFLEHVLFH